MNYNGKIKKIGVRSALRLIAVGIVLNMLPNKIVEAFDIPLFLDCTGTLLCAMLGGIFPAVVVGFTTNILKGLWGDYSAFFGVIHIFIALMSVFFYNNKFFSNPFKIIIAILFYAMLGGGFGSIFTYFLNKQDFGIGGSAPFVHLIHQTFNTSIFVSQFIADSIIDIADKTLVVLLALFIIHRIPQKIKNHLNHIFLRSKKQNHSNLIAIRPLLKKVVMVVVVSELLLAILVTNIGYFLYKEKAIEKYTTLAKGITEAVAITLDKNDLPNFLQEGRNNPNYGKIEEKLYAIKEGYPEAKNILIFKPDSIGLHVIFNLASKDNEIRHNPGDIIPSDSTVFKHKLALIHGDSVLFVETENSKNWLLTVYNPIKDSLGNTLAYTTAGISNDSIISDEMSFLIKVLSLFIGASLVIMCFIMEIIKRGIVVPIDRMSQTAMTFAYNSEAGRKISVRRVQALKIKTGNEIENLYKAFSTMAEDFLRYIIQYKAQNDRISRMQEEIIVNFAELVEARDEGTGNHIKQTAAYVEAIAKELQKEGPYKNLMTNEYITQLKRSAPLHDIGKIAVSDLILNKPGKLTDEEFEIMKSHTTEGFKILQKIVDNTGDSMEADYLKEAIEMAHYHHEKWNGTGYPTGISGEEIPLSARIMAVADVFDALVANRVYKKAFSFEKAMSIIKEGAGTHFDPNVVKAFEKIALSLYNSRADALNNM